MPRIVRLVCAAAFATVGVYPLVATAPVRAADGIQLRVLSSRPDMVSGGDALVRVDLPAGMAARDVKLTVNGTDATAKLKASRLLAVYQPHGYGPTRFLRRDFVDTFTRELRPEDRLWMLEVFYAGGTAARDFSAADIVREIAENGARAEFAPSRPWLAARITREARPGDLVLVMGARDPSLSALARAILAAIDKAAAPQPAK